jgi:hypothetical protein
MRPRYHTKEVLEVDPGTGLRLSVACVLWQQLGWTFFFRVLKFKLSLTLARKGLYHLSQAPSPFFVGVFFHIGHHASCLGMPQTVIFLYTAPA